MLLTKNNTIIIGQVATLLGLLMNAIFIFTDGAFGISNIGVCIIYIGYLCPAHSTHDQTAEVFKDVCDHES